MGIKKTILIVIIITFVIWFVLILLTFKGVLEPQIEYIEPNNAIKENAIPVEIKTFYELYNKQDYQNIQNLFLFEEEIYSGAIMPVREFREYYGKITDYHLHSVLGSTENRRKYIITVKYENIPEDLKTFDSFTLLKNEETQKKKFIAYSSGAFNIEI
jgi:hypothetical protein